MKKPDPLVRALVDSLVESVSLELTVRGYLDKTGHNVPDAPVEDCLDRLVQDYLRLRNRS